MLLNTIIVCTNFFTPEISNQSQLYYCWIETLILALLSFITTLLNYTVDSQEIETFFDVCKKSSNSLNQESLNFTKHRLCETQINQTAID